MACVKERRQKNVKFGLSKDDNFEVENSAFPCDPGNSFSSARDYWQHMCRNPESEDRRADVSLICNGIAVTTNAVFRRNSDKSWTVNRY